MQLMGKLQKIKNLILSALLFGSLFGTAVIAGAQSITQGYDIDSNVVVQRGMIVALKEDDPKKVEPINSTASKRMHGVVVGSSDSSFVLAEESQKLYVATGGKYEVLVSNQNGNINAGDMIAVSPITGIGMRSDEYQEMILGKSIVGFDGSVGKLSEATIKDAQGNDIKIDIGRIQVDIAIMRNPTLKSTASLPSFLRDASEFIAGKPVNPVRVYISVFILLVTASVSGSLIYSGIRSGMIAIGRNPLSKKSILRGIFQVVLVGLIIFLSGIFGVYLLLKL